jgi:hypothetical protein
MSRNVELHRRRAQKSVQRRWDLPAGSRVWCYLRHSPGDNSTIDSQAAGMRQWSAWAVHQRAHLLLGEREHLLRSDPAGRRERLLDRIQIHPHPLWIGCCMPGPWAQAAVSSILRGRPAASYSSHRPAFPAYKHTDQ